MAENKEGKTDLKHEKKLELDNGLSIWLVDINFLRERDLNARFMEPEKFQALVNNISKEKRLESLPLTVKIVNPAGNTQFQIISGHHRVRAARQAKVREIYVLAYEEFTEDQIKAKQLSHNILDGKDDYDIVKEIYDSIINIEAKIESAFKDTIEYTSPDINQKDIALELDFEILNIVFLPSQKEVFEDVMELIGEDETYYSDMAVFKKFKKSMRKVAREENVRNISSILYKMSYLVSEYYKEKQEREKAEKEAK